MLVTTNTRVLTPAQADLYARVKEKGERLEALKVELLAVRSEYVALVKQLDESLHQPAEEGQAHA